MSVYTFSPGICILTSVLGDSYALVTLRTSLLHDALTICRMGEDMYVNSTCITLKALVRDDNSPTFKMWLRGNRANAVYLFCCIVVISRWKHVNY